MSGETNYTPGNSVHFIQARKALEDVGQWSATSLSRISDRYIELLDEYSNFIIECKDSDRLLKVQNTGRIPKNDKGKSIAFLSSYNVLIVPCADEHKIFPQSAPIHAQIVYIENGAALWSPTTDGLWHLFSFAPTGMIF
jgi:hypothetical protein